MKPNMAHSFSMETVTAAIHGIGTIHRGPGKFNSERMSAFVGL